MIKTQKIYDKFKKYLNWGVKIILILLGLLLLKTIIKGLKHDGYIVQPVQVPKYFADNGYNEIVVANRIQDEILKIKKEISSLREDSISIQANSASDLNIQVLGIGISSSNVTYHLRNFLGIQNKTIGGDLTQLGDELRFTLRITGYPNEVFIETYTDGDIDDAFEKLLLKIARGILYHTNPYHLAINLFSNDNMKEAKKVIREMINNRPGEEKWAYLAWSNMESVNDPEKAQEYALKALEIDPDFALANRNLAWNYVSTLEYNKALDHFQKAHEANPESFSAVNGLAICYRNLGESELAEKYYRLNLENHKKELYSYGNYAGFLTQIKKDTQAVAKIFQEASLNLSQNEDYYVAASGALFFQNYQDSALEMAQKALDINENNVGGLQLMSGYYGIKGDHEGREKYILKLVEIANSGNYDKFMKMDSYNQLAMNNYHLGKYDESLINAQKAIDIIPTNPFPWSTLAEGYSFMGNDEKFFENIKIAIDFGLVIEPEWFEDAPYAKYKDNSRLKKMIDDAKLKG